MWNAEILFITCLLERVDLVLNDARFTFIKLICMLFDNQIRFCHYWHESKFQFVEHLVCYISPRNLATETLNCFIMLTSTLSEINIFFINLGCSAVCKTFTLVTANQWLLQFGQALILIMSMRLFNNSKFLKFFKIMRFLPFLYLYFYFIYLFSNTFFILFLLELSQ